MMNEKWKHVIDSRQYGVRRVVLMLIPAVLFTVLAVDQWQPQPNKIWLLGVLFAAIAVILGGTAVASAVRTIWFCVRVGEDGFYCRTTPWNGGYYPYADAVSCRTEHRWTHHRGTTEVSHGYFCIVTMKNGAVVRFRFERELHRDAVKALKAQINHK